MYTNADVILPVTTATDQTYLMAVVSLRTCRASCGARVHAYLNNSPETRLRARLIEQCFLLGISVIDWREPFSLSKIFNHGTDNTAGDYIVHATSDVIFYPGWLDNIIDLWKQHPEFYTLGNYSFDDENMPCVKHNVMPERRVVATHNPSAGLNVFRRQAVYRWDEHFTIWEMDTDLQMYIEKNGLRAGYCLNSRADHLINCVKSCVPGTPGYDASAYVRKKWGMPEPK